MAAIGATLFKMDGNPHYSPPFPRNGLGATFVANVTHIAGTPSFQITVEHRNSTETGWASAGSFSPITAVGLSELDVEDLKEIIRIRYQFDGGDASTDGVHFSMQAPSRRPYAA